MSALDLQKEKENRRVKENFLPKLKESGKEVSLFSGGKKMGLPQRSRKEETTMGKKQDYESLLGKKHPRHGDVPNRPAFYGKEKGGVLKQAATSSLLLYGLNKKEHDSTRKKTRTYKHISQIGLINKVLGRVMNLP